MKFEEVVLELKAEQEQIKLYGPQVLSGRRVPTPGLNMCRVRLQGPGRHGPVPDGGGAGKGGAEQLNGVTAEIHPGTAAGKHATLQNGNILGSHFP